jgi:hypothetical protein
MAVKFLDHMSAVAETPADILRRIGLPMPRPGTKISRPTIHQATHHLESRERSAVMRALDNAGLIEGL